MSTTTLEHAEAHEHEHDEHRDDFGDKMAMWLFIYTEILLFGGLLIVYAVYRFLYPTEFALAASELNVTIGTINTVMLLISSMTVAMSISAIQYGHYKTTFWLLVVSIFLGSVFLVNKYFEWGAKFSHHVYPGSEHVNELGAGDIIFIGLYYLMTGLHALHIIIGLVLLIITAWKVKIGKIRSDDFVLLENSGLYWHLIDLIWIFLFPLLYLI